MFTDKEFHHGPPPEFHHGPPQQAEPENLKANGPYRETLQSLVARRLHEKKREVAALEQLVKLASIVDAGSPLEELLWSLANRM